MFIEEVKKKADAYAHSVYRATRSFPSEERHGLTSQLRRSALSVALNLIEGFARVSENETRNFFRIAYGSLKESEYLLDFSLKEGYLIEEDFQSIAPQANELGAILWKMIQLRSH